MPDTIPIRRALLSVSDKTGLGELAARLHARGVELVSTGGTARALRQTGLPVTPVEDVTGHPEIMDGRVKTLHPRIHGGLLARDGDEAVLAEHGIARFDLLVVNLYPFERVRDSDAAREAVVENIDIGGPAMLRAAAKNHERVAVCCDPSQYALLDGATTRDQRRALAAAAFAHTARYDVAIASWMGERGLFAGRLAGTMRYGENPHQSAALYLDGSGAPGPATAERVQGKDLSYNNVADADAAFALASEFERPAVVIVKHANPCGAALGETLAAAHARALACDPTSAFGGIVAVNRPLDRAAAEAIAGVFTEVVIAPAADEGAREVLAGRPNLRLLLTGRMADPHMGGFQVRSVAGGLLVQSTDDATASEFQVVTRRAPGERETADLRFAFTVAKHVKSNAIVLAKDGATLGIGAGQMSRVDSSRIAAMKAAGAGHSTEDAVVASDAFFPFADGLVAAAEAGATALIQPGGSKRDEEVIAAADERGLAMVFTGMRHFRH